MKTKNIVVLLFSTFLLLMNISVCYADVWIPPAQYIEFFESSERSEGSYNDSLEKKANDLNIRVAEFYDYLLYDNYNIDKYYDEEGNPIGDGFSYEDYLECLKRDKMENIAGAIGVVVVLVFWIFILVYFCKKIKVLKTNKEIDTENLGNIDEEAC